jgi:DNA-nicking Smr family endonuclease
MNILQFYNYPILQLKCVAKIVVDLHDCFNNGTKIDAALNNAIDEAVATGTKLVEIIPGKGSGQLKKSVLRFFRTKTHQATISQNRKRQQKFRKAVCAF